MTMNAMTASAAVTEMLLVAVAPQGSRPRRFMASIKKKTVSRYGAYPSPWWPTLGSTTSWRTQSTIASMAPREARGRLALPLGPDVGACTENEDQGHQRRRQQHVYQVLGRGQIEVARPAVGVGSERNLPVVGQVDDPERSLHLVGVRDMVSDIDLILAGLVLARRSHGVVGCFRRRLLCQNRRAEGPARHRGQSQPHRYCTPATNRSCLDLGIFP